MSIIDGVLGALQTRPMTAAEVAKTLGVADTDCISRAICRLRAKGVVTPTSHKPRKSNPYARKVSMVYGLTGKPLVKKRGGMPKKWPAYLDGAHSKKRRHDLLMRYKAELEAHGFTVLAPAKPNEAE